MSELRKYGVLLTTAKAIQFTLFQIDGVDLEPAATFATGDIKISKDGGAEANTANLPTDEGQGYRLILTAAELTASRIRIFIVDQTATKIWLDIEINIETYGNASAMHAFDFNIAAETMRGTDNAALASVCTEARLAELAAANLPADIDTLLTRITGTLAAGTHNPATAAQIAVLSDWINGGRLDLILDIIAADVVNIDGAAMRGTDNALLAANINLTGGAVDTVTTLTNKTGFSLAATGLDLITQSATGVIEFAKAFWDRVLTGATHNIADSGGRRVRNLQEFGNYEDNRVWVDTINGSAGTTDYESGTILNKINNVADSNTIGASLGLEGRGIAPGSSIAFAASQEGQDWKGNIWSLNLGGQSVSNTHIFGAEVSGVCSGINPPEFHECFVGNITVPPCVFKNSDMGGIITLPVGIVHIHNCAGDAGFILDYGVAVADTTVHLSAFSGDLVVDNLGQNGADILDIRGHGKVTFNASCVGGIVNWDGHFTIVDNGSGITFNSDDISSNVEQVLTDIAALNDPTAAAVAAAVAAYDMGNGRTIEEALAFLRNKWTIIAGTLTVYDTDDTTVLWTSVMTQTAGDPVSSSDPA